MRRTPLFTIALILALAIAAISTLVLAQPRGGESEAIQGEQWEYLVVAGGSVNLNPLIARLCSGARRIPTAGVLRWSETWTRSARRVGIGSGYRLAGGPNLLLQAAKIAFGALSGRCSSPGADGENLSAGPRAGFS